VEDQDGRPGDSTAPEAHERDLAQRVTELESQVIALTAALDAASRMQVATPERFNQDIRLAGGRLVRRILEKSGLVDDHHEAPAPGETRLTTP
jgi:hypothetical protein